MNNFWEEFESGKIAINCKDEWAVMNFFKQANRAGYHWSDNTPLNFESKAEWMYGYNTFYACSNKENHEFFFGDVRFIAQNKYTLYDWESMSPKAKVDWYEYRRKKGKTFPNSTDTLLQDIFNWDEFKTGSIAVHCKTKEEAKDFLQQVYDNGIRWMSNDNVLHSRWNTLKEETCYRYNTTDKLYGFDGLDYSNKDFYLDNGYRIIEWADYMEKEKISTPLTFNWEAFNEKQLQVCCHSKEEAEDFCNEAHFHSFRWRNGEFLLNNFHWTPTSEKNGAIYYRSNNNIYSRDVICDYEAHPDIEIVNWFDYMDKNKISGSINYDIVKKLNDISIRMHGTQFEQDRIILLDAIEEITRLRNEVASKDFKQGELSSEFEQFMKDKEQNELDLD